MGYVLREGSRLDSLALLDHHADLSGDCPLVLKLLDWSVVRWCPRVMKSLRWRSIYLKLKAYHVPKDLLEVKHDRPFQHPPVPDIHLGQLVED